MSFERALTDLSEDRRAVRHWPSGGERGEIGVRLGEPGGYDVPQK
ncbi:hypothetical protein ACWDA7_23705 [Streptomyces sp. NPDC001156]